MKRMKESFWDILDSFAAQNTDWPADETHDDDSRKYSGFSLPVRMLRLFGWLGGGLGLLGVLSM